MQIVAAEVGRAGACKICRLLNLPQEFAWSTKIVQWSVRDFSQNIVNVERHVYVVSMHCALGRALYNPIAGDSFFDTDFYPHGGLALLAPFPQYHLARRASRLLNLSHSVRANDLRRASHRSLFGSGAGGL